MSILAVAAACGAYLAWPMQRVHHVSRTQVVCGLIVAVICGLRPIAVLGSVVMCMQWMRARSARRTTQPNVSLTNLQCARATATMSVCVSAGVTTLDMWKVLAQSTDSHIAQVGRVVVAALQSGVDVSSAYDAIGAAHPGLGPSVALMQAAMDSGAAVADSLSRYSADLLEREHDALTARVRSLGVKATLPLGGCFLPAFILVAVVPMAASLL